MRFYLYPAILAVAMLLLYIPDLFPECSCCRAKKFRPFFSIHKAVGINPGYGGNRSVCRKCCRKYGIENLKDLDRFIVARNKVKLDSFSRDP
ncbi:MAG: hypothetical protein ACOX4M_00225 [Acetivibrionales bacterium]